MPEVPIVIPSHGRAGEVATLRAVSGAILCVAESQRDAYAREHPGVELVVHPDDVLGLSPKRQWIYERFGDVLMLDDDHAACRRLYDPDEASVVTPDEAYELIQATYQMACDVGAYLWGFASNSIGRNYPANRPFRTTGYVQGAALGLRKSEHLSFPDDPHCTVEDYYVSGLNAFYHRFIWCDDRFGWEQKHTMSGRGGMAAYRNTGHEERWFHELQELFGSKAITHKHMARHHKWERILHIPWAMRA